MSPSDIISVFAVVVSIVAIVVSVIIHRNQRKYIKTQDELNRLLLSKEKSQLESVNEANVSAIVVRMDSKIARIRVFNKGEGRANNVRISYPETKNWLIMDDVLPLEFLDSGQSVDLKLALYSSSQRKLKVLLTWNDKRGEKSNEVILTI